MRVAGTISRSAGYLWRADAAHGTPAQNDFPFRRISVAR
jgi:hypothetical protein